ncbi:MAG: asparaginase domain-containing protein [Candidatus Micrarchaeaceae archaeon]
MTKNIAILTTGGTISSLSSSKGLKPAEGVIKYILQKLSFNNEILISDDGKTKLKIFPILNKDSTNITLYDQALLANEVFALNKKFDGIVITHGTDTMQFTSSLLSIMLEKPKIPIVITGSMKTIEEKDTDAIENLNGAIESAKSDLNGVFVFFHGNLMPGQLVYETKTDSGLTFKSAIGNVAVLKNNLLSYDISNLNKKNSSHMSLNANYNSNICTITISPNNNELFLNQVNTKYDGLILLSYGSVGIPERYSEVIDKIIKKNIPIVLSSQIPSVHMGHGNYEINKIAKELGIIPGIGLYSFDYSNMASSLGKLLVGNNNLNINKFEQLFNENIKIALSKSYLSDSSNNKNTSQKIYNEYNTYSPKNVIPPNLKSLKRKSFVTKLKSG